jgi:hypothetical protein
MNNLDRKRINRSWGPFVQFRLSTPRSLKHRYGPHVAPNGFVRWHAFRLMRAFRQYVLEILPERPPLLLLTGGELLDRFQVANARQVGVSLPV